MTIQSAPPSCPEASRTRRLVRARETDDLTLADARLLRAHLAACPACRSEAVSLDPTLLFSPIAGGPDADAGEARRMASDVRAVLESRRVDRRMQRPRHTFLAAAALLVVGAGLAGLLALRPWAGVPTSQPPVAEVAAAGVRYLPARESAPLVERVESPDVKVYQFAADAPGQPSVVFVVDRNADL